MLGINLGYHTMNKIERRDVGSGLDTPVPLLSVLIDDEFIEMTLKMEILEYVPEHY